MTISSESEAEGYCDRNGLLFLLMSSVQLSLCLFCDDQDIILFHSIFLDYPHVWFARSEAGFAANRESSYFYPSCRSFFVPLSELVSSFLILLVCSAHALLCNDVIFDCADSHTCVLHSERRTFEKKISNLENWVCLQTSWTFTRSVSVRYWSQY